MPVKASLSVIKNEWLSPDEPLIMILGNSLPLTVVDAPRLLLRIILGILNLLAVMIF